VSVGNWHVWGIDRFHQMYQRIGVSADNISGDSWDQTERYMAWVSTAEEGIVWSLDDKGDVFVLKTGSISVDPFVPNNELGWTHAPDALLIQVDVGYNSQVAGVDEEGQVYWRTGITDGAFGGDGWTTIPDSPLMNHVTVCDTGIFWGSTPDHKVFMRSGVDDDTPMGTEWIEVISDLHNLRQVSCGRRGWLVGRDTSNRLLMRGEISADNDQGNFWTEVDSSLEVRYASIGIDGQIWAVSMDGTPMMRTDVNDEQPTGTGWVHVTNSESH